MSKFNEHSPLPWLTESSWGFGGIQDAEGDIVFALAAPRAGEKNHGKIAQCNDDFILEACNSYYQNKEAIKELVEVLKTVSGKNSTNFKLKAPDYLIDMVDQAIEKHG